MAPKPEARPNIQKTPGTGSILCVFGPDGPCKPQTPPEMGSGASSPPGPKTQRIQTGRGWCFNICGRASGSLAIGSGLVPDFPSRHASPTTGACSLDVQGRPIRVACWQLLRAKGPERHSKATLGSLIHGFWADRRSSKFGAAGTPKNDDVRSVQNHVYVSGRTWPQDPSRRVRL
jgi:hypothetical protein